MKGREGSKRRISNSLFFSFLSFFSFFFFFFSSFHLSLFPLSVQYIYFFMYRIDLNADAGEGFDDEGLLKYVTSVNIACGGHVGSPDSIARTVFLATRAGAR